MDPLLATESAGIVFVGNGVVGCMGCMGSGCVGTGGRDARMLAEGEILGRGAGIGDGDDEESKGVGDMGLYEANDVGSGMTLRGVEVRLAGGPWVVSADVKIGVEKSAGGS